LTKSQNPTISTTDTEPSNANNIISNDHVFSLGSGSHHHSKVHRGAKFLCFLGFILILFLGRKSVPDNEIICVKDRVIDAFYFANKFINTPGNEFYRDLFQAICSLFVDTAFFTTLGYWVLHSTSIRLPITLGVFYGVRALIQAIWFSPFPDGFYWMSPGFPSLVVPYGRGSDFFFSGHAGFMVICTMEWHKVGKRKLRNAMIAATLYTFLILLVYRIHYSIDIFTGAIFAEWCFGKIDTHCKGLDKIWISLLARMTVKSEEKDLVSNDHANRSNLERQI